MKSQPYKVPRHSPTYFYAIAYIFYYLEHNFATIACFLRSYASQFTLNPCLVEHAFEKKTEKAFFAKAQFNRIGTVGETTCASIALRQKYYPQ